VIDVFVNALDLAEMSFEGVAALPNGRRKRNLLKLAEGYRDLANIKRIVLRKSELTSPKW
jgi:hypothetical protein